MAIGVILAIEIVYNLSENKLGIKCKEVVIREPAVLTSVTNVEVAKTVTSLLKHRYLSLA